MNVKPTTIGRREIEYPCCDDQPMSDTDPNIERMHRTLSALKEAFRRRKTTAYASSDIFVYPVEGRQGVRNSPDILVASGCEQRERPSFKCWEEPGGIEFAGEFLQITKCERLDSPKLEKKVRFYQERLRTRELFLYEPKGLTSADGFEFRFLRLSPEGECVRVEPDAQGWYESQVLGLLLRPAPLQLDFMDPVTGERYLSDLERANAAEAENRRLRALLEGRAGGPERRATE